MRAFAILQTADGAWHWASVLQVSGWFIAGLLLLGGLVINRADRVKSGPWEFSSAQEAAFTAALGKEPKGKIVIEYTKADEKRAFEFAMKLKAIFEAAGYDVWDYVPAFIQSSGPPITGVQLKIKKDTPSDVVGGSIQRSFAAADIIATGIVRNDNNYEDDRAVIQIGIKP